MEKTKILTETNLELIEIYNQTNNNTSIYFA